MKKITILLFLFAFVDLAIAQVKPDAVLAGAGNRKITVKEFIRRFEFIPMVKKKGLDREKQKENFLYSLRQKNYGLLPPKMPVTTRRL